MNTWRILSDNLVGGLETAAAWGDGEIPVFLDDTQESTAAVQVLVTETRHAAPTEMGQLLSKSLNWFTKGNCTFLKVDSLLRGNALTEIAWLMRSGRFTNAVLAHANPGLGRFIAQGHYWMASPNQPYGPRSHEHMEPLDQALERAGLQAHIPATLGECLQTKGKVLIPDLLSQADLDVLAALSTQPQASYWLWCGSTGMARALSQLQNGAGSGHRTPPQLAVGPGRMLLLTSSRHPVLREQLHQLALHKLPIEQVDLLPSATLPNSQEQEQQHLLQRMKALVAHHTRPGLLVVVGGLNLSLLCEVTGATSLIAGASPRPGWWSARMVGGRWDGLSCYLHSGNLAPTDDICGLFVHQLFNNKQALATSS